MRIRTQMNCHLFEQQTEYNDGSSITVPDQAMSIKEIVSRYVRGLPIDGAKVSYYDENNTEPDIDYMDFADQEEYIEEKRVELAELQEKIKKSKTKKNETSQSPPVPPKQTQGESQEIGNTLDANGL